MKVSEVKVRPRTGLVGLVWNRSLMTVVVGILMFGISLLALSWNIFDDSPAYDVAPMAFRERAMDRGNHLRLGRKPSLAIVGFESREGSSWFMSLLEATQRLSISAKICVIGFEPLEHRATHLNISNARVIETRKNFYMEMTRLETETEEKWLAWIDRLNRILKVGGFPPLNFQTFCDRSSALYMFKTRLASHFSMRRVTPQASIWLRQFSDRMRDIDGKIIVLTRRSVLHRAVTNCKGQFELAKAKTEEERKSVLVAHSKVKVDPKKVHREAVHYQFLTERVSKIARRIQVPSLTIHYETLVVDFEKEMTEIFRFLNLPVEYSFDALRKMGKFEKVSPSRLCEKVANYEELCEYMSRTSFAGDLDEPCNTKGEPRASE